MSKPINNVLTFLSPSILLPDIRTGFQKGLFERICDHLNPLVFIHPATYVHGTVHNRIKYHGNQSKL